MGQAGLSDSDVMRAGDLEKPYSAASSFSFQVAQLGGPGHFPLVEVFIVGPCTVAVIRYLQP